MNYKGIPLPDNLRDDVAEYMRVLLDDMEAGDCLKNIDSCAYYMLATSYNTYCDCQDLIEQHGYTTTSSAGNISIAPWVKISKESLTSILRILQEIGATRRARKSISALEKNGADADAESPLQKFMNESAAML